MRAYGQGAGRLPGTDDLRVVHQPGAAHPRLLAALVLVAGGGHHERPLGHSVVDGQAQRAGPVRAAPPVSARERRGEMVETEAHAEDVRAEVKRLVDAPANPGVPAAAVGPQYLHVDQLHARCDARQHAVAGGEDAGAVGAVRARDRARLPAGLDPVGDGEGRVLGVNAGVKDRDLDALSGAPAGRGERAQPDVGYGAVQRHDRKERVKVGELHPDARMLGHDGQLIHRHRGSECVASVQRLDLFDAYLGVELIDHLAEPVADTALEHMPVLRLVWAEQIDLENDGDMRHRIGCRPQLGGRSHEELGPDAGLERSAQPRTRYADHRDAPLVRRGASVEDLPVDDRVHAQAKSLQVSDC